MAIVTDLTKYVEPTEIIDDFTAEDIAAEYALNMPCDFSGLCAGHSCPNFFKCQGGH